jgi:hypothetical protein
MVGRLASAASAAGSAVHLLTGMFFASEGPMPTSIHAALEHVGHVSVSIDEFHEREVPRRAVFATLERLIGDGKDVSVQTVARGAQDGYLLGLINDVITRFAGQVPILASALRAEGRARTWLEPSGGPGGEPVDIAPCLMAAWPVVNLAGTVLACCNQQVVDGAPLPHLSLGAAQTQTWEGVRERVVSSPVLRVLRTGGPRLATDLLGRRASPSYCGTCHTLGQTHHLGDRLSEAFNPDALAALDVYLARERVAAGAEAFAQRLAWPEHSRLVTLGYQDGRHDAA